jgi:hypothetical protein
MSMKNSSDITGNRTRELPACILNRLSHQVVPKLAEGLA